MVDMHIHTTYSDGLDSYEDIVEKTKNYDLFSITDHDNIISSQKINANNFVSGAEFTIYDKELSLNEEIHFLAYNYNPYDKILNKKMQEFNYYNNLNYIKSLIDIAIANKIKIDLSCLKKYVHDKVTLSKVQLTKILIQQGFGTDLIETYNKYVRGFCNQRYHNLTYKELYKIIKDCGGYILLAHPFVYADKTDNLINNLYKMGIDGIEISKNYEEETMNYIKKYNFIYSIGSDYHGVSLPRCNVLGIDDSKYKDDKNYIKNKIVN